MIIIDVSDLLRHISVFNLPGQQLQEIFDYLFKFEDWNQSTFVLLQVESTGRWFPLMDIQFIVYVHIAIL